SAVEPETRSTEDAVRPSGTFKRPSGTNVRPLIPVRPPDQVKPRLGGDEPSPVRPRPLNSRRTREDEEVPDVYRARVAPDRAKIASETGGDAKTESAVQSALKWLAANQGRDGGWSASKHGAGREMHVAGQNRDGAGSQADSGVTGLALLAFMGAGQTHQQGKYRETVRRGMEYLIRIQAADGSLAGNAKLFARMYCHAMAAFALSECYAMTGDPAMERPVRSAVNYTLRAQHSQDGSWRYKPGDQGDTSVLGWQVMVLKSAEEAGLGFPKSSRDRIIRYLNKVSSGRGGLACYRHGDEVSRTMSAEAFMCWSFLGVQRSSQANRETAEYLLQKPPGKGRANYYYWYYATLAMHRIQGSDWDRWNRALTDTLVKTQRDSGSLEGSWDPTSVWGGYGGRVYSTATAALCLEVYYRFLPSQSKTASRRRSRATN
ncbi:MAG: terpene cyclase/mutase family protein, partial [Planctomycetales bacterium]